MTEEAQKYVLRGYYECFISHINNSIFTNEIKLEILSEMAQFCDQKFAELTEHQEHINPDNVKL